MEVKYKAGAQVAMISLAAPDRRNVLSRSMIEELSDALQVAHGDDAVRVIVLTGEGNTFCAGADLAGSATGADFAESGPRALAALLTTMLELPKPIVGRVQGHVAGGGNGLVAACDISIAVESAKFAFSEVRVGVAPAVISVVCTARIGPTAARELMLTGERISATRAVEIGLVTRVAPAESFDGAISAVTDSLLAGGPLALSATKELLRTVPTLSRDEAFDYAADVSSQLFGSDEAREGMTAFLERRPAPWVPTT